MAKRQKLTISDMAYIDDAVLKGKNVVEIIEYIGKQPQYVYDYIEKVKKVNTPEEVISSELRTKPEWEFIQQQFTHEEIRYYETCYNRMLEQFKEDVVYTEETQVHKAIELDIFMLRNKINKRRTVDQIKHLENELKYELELDTTEKNQAKINVLREQLAGMQSVMTSNNREYTDLLNQHTKIMETLQGTRNQLRSKQFNQKRDVISILKDLEDEEYRQNQIIQMELGLKAADKKRKDLESLHTYVDGVVDPPILNTDSIKNG